MKLCLVENLPHLHTTPLEIVHINHNKVTVEADDEGERRFRFVLSPFQAVRMTTIDCFSSLSFEDFVPKRIAEVINSDWIEQLRKELSRNDVTATFMNRARHFLFPFQDNVLEVVAHRLEIAPCDAPGQVDNS